MVPSARSCIAGCRRTPRRARAARTSLPAARRTCSPRSRRCRSPCPTPRSSAAARRRGSVRLERQDPRAGDRVSGSRTVRGGSRRTRARRSGRDRAGDCQEYDELTGRLPHQQRSVSGCRPSPSGRSLIADVWKLRTAELRNARGRGFPDSRRARVSVGSRLCCPTDRQASRHACTSSDSARSRRRTRYEARVRT